MYQALYRKWRPRSFSEVVGQAHITETLKSQVAADRLSHAYLFTGSRGTGKTSCAKILARAVNCEAPVGGDPCNQCPSCRGIEDGSILDVLELDAASNNGVDQVRALRDEAVYTPGAVKKRVYIVDEVHMLSTPAFNALLKILEEPPAHLMFILATTELHKVPATIKSRCQQFAFRRIRAEEIISQLMTIAETEGFTLTQDAALLLSRLADGGLRDALSLLDQCVGRGEKIDEARVLQVLGLAGERETAKLAGEIANEDAAAALATVSRLYQDGKDMSALLGELSVLFRDLLLFKTTKSSGALQSGGYAASVLERLSAGFTAEELVQMLSILQKAAAELVYSSNRRSDVELCILRLCRRGLATDLEGLLARLSRLEENVAQGVSLVEKKAKLPPEKMPEQLKPAPVEAVESPPWAETAQEESDSPPWEETVAEGSAPRQAEAMPAAELPPWDTVPEEEQVIEQPVPVAKREAEAPRPAKEAFGFWPALVAALREKLPPSAYSLLSKVELVRGVLDGDVLTIYLDSEMNKKRLDKAEILDSVKAEAAAQRGIAVKVKLQVGAAPSSVPDKLGELLEKGRQNSGIVSII